MHVVLLNQAFYPDVVATAQMGKDLAEELSRAGHTVTAIASRSVYGKSGATLPPRENIPVPGAQDIRVIRVGSSLFGRKGTLLRLIDFALFYVRAAWALLRVQKPDVVIAFSTPPYIALLALFTRALRGSKAVYWAMDLYPDVMVPSGMLKPTSILYRLLSCAHTRLVKSADATVVLGRCMLARIHAKLPEDHPARARVWTIPVWSDDADVHPCPRATNPVRAEWNLAENFTVMYSGNFGIGHDAKTLLDAMLLLQDQRDEKGNPVRFVFVGGGKRRAEVEAFIAQHNLTHASYHDYQPRERLAQSLSAGDLHFISLRDGMEGLIVPSKLYGIMACARPSIFVGPETSEVALVIQESGCGSVLPIGDAPRLARSIMGYANDAQETRRAGEAARAAFAQKYTKSHACAGWAQLIASLG